MAFDFIKKVFTFGRKAEEDKALAAAPAQPEQPALAPYIGIAEQPVVETPAVEAKAPAPVIETHVVSPPAGLPETEVLPLFYHRDETGVPRGWVHRMRASMRSIIPRFSAHRMVGDYAASLYR